MELRVTRTGSTKVTQHNITSPLKDINAACKSCHKAKTT
ncbi:ammonia-forming cytochrome c nitrite reductase subunit c552 [Campylobacter sp.]